MPIFLKKTLLHNLIHRLLSGCLLLMTMLSGCQNVYAPTMQNVPLLQEKGDLQLVANPNNLQTAYALSDHVVLMANGSYHHKARELKDTARQSVHHYTSYRYNIEGAAGYFRKIHKNYILEALGGAGYGHVNLHSHPYYLFSKYDAGRDPDEHHKLSATARRIFIQPAIGLSKEAFELSFSSRLVALQFSDVSINYASHPFFANNPHSIHQPTYLFLEPAFTARVGLKWIKLQTQLIYSAKLNKRALDYRPLAFSFGLQLNLSKQFRQSLRKQ